MTLSCPTASPSPPMNACSTLTILGAATFGPSTCCPTAPWRSRPIGSSPTWGATSPAFPDGMKVDVEGNVYCGGAGGIWIMDARGTKLGRIVHGAPATTNLAFGGDDWKTLYFTSRNHLGLRQREHSRHSCANPEKVNDCEHRSVYRDPNDALRIGLSSRGRERHERLDIRTYRWPLRGYH